MKRWIPLLALALAGCASDQLLTPPSMDAAPAPFPYPGVYNGATSGGQMTFQIGADGRGLSCTRSLAGRMAFGDITYTGGKLYTETLAFNVARVTDSDLVLEWPMAHAPTLLRKVSEPPTTCREFFAKSR